MNIFSDDAEINLFVDLVHPYHASVSWCLPAESQFFITETTVCVIKSEKQTVNDKKNTRKEANLI